MAGSWKMMPMRPPRTPRMARSDRSLRSVPPSSIWPPTMRPASGSSRSRASAVMLLPLPDSPTRAKVSPCATASCSRLTACVTPDSPATSTSSPSMRSKGADAVMAGLPPRPRAPA
ncbi:Uncharacterised protein [Bordetella pertussis]|nr:Uncharacterised protein [Bordetella pertussis]